MSDRGLFLYDFVELSDEEVLVGLKLDVPTHAALASLIYQKKHVAERLVKLARAGLLEDFEKAAMLVLFEDHDVELTKVDYDRLGRLLVLAWRDEPLESVPVKQRPRPPSLRRARDAGDTSAYNEILRRNLRNLGEEIAEIAPSHPEGQEE